MGGGAKVEKEAIGEKKGRKCGGWKRRLNRILGYVGRSEGEGKIAGGREGKGGEKDGEGYGRWRQEGEGKGRWGREKEMSTEG